jgi:hypothetical protein
MCTMGVVVRCKGCELVPANTHSAGHCVVLLSVPNPLNAGPQHRLHHSTMHGGRFLHHSNRFVLVLSETLNLDDDQGYLVE